MRLQAPAVRARPALDSLTARLAARVCLAAVARIRVGRLTVTLPNGTRRTYGDPASEDSAEIAIHDREAFARILFGGEIGAGEAYMDDLWSSPDLAAVLRLASRNRESLALTSGWIRGPARLRKHARASCATEHETAEPAEHRGALRPRQ